MTNVKANKAKELGKKFVGVYLDDPVHYDLKLMAHKRRQTMHELISQILEHYHKKWVVGNED